MISGLAFPLAETGTSSAIGDPWPGEDIREVLIIRYFVPGTIRLEYKGDGGNFD